MKASDLRRGKRYPKAPCFICEKHETITEWHHATPVSDVAKSFNDFGIEQDGAQMYCLCPCCHAYIHKMYSAHISSDFKAVLTRLLETLNGLYTPDQKRKFMEIYTIFERCL